MKSIFAFLFSFLTIHTLAYAQCDVADELFDATPALTQPIETPKTKITVDPLTVNCSDERFYTKDTFLKKLSNQQCKPGVVIIIDSEQDCGTLIYKARAFEEKTFGLDTISVTSGIVTYKVTYNSETSQETMVREFANPGKGGYIVIDLDDQDAFAMIHFEQNNAKITFDTIPLSLSN